MRIRAYVVLAIAAMTVFSSVLWGLGPSPELCASTEVGPGEFIISYSNLEYSPETSELLTNWTFKILSSGVWYSNWTGRTETDHALNRTGNISWQLARSTFECILFEWHINLLKYHRDLGSPGGAKRTVLAVEWFDSNLNAIFEGFSMMGLMPKSFIAINNIVDMVFWNRTEPLNVSLEVSAASTGGNVTSLVAIFSNNEEILLYQGSTRVEDWPLWIVRVNGHTASDFHKVVPLSLVDFEPGTVTVFDSQEWNWSGMAPGFYIAMVRIVVYNYVLLTVPETSGAVNQRPIAEFTVTPTQGNRSTLFRVDATMSTDWEENSTDLIFRWDWEGDGKWDTDWSPSRQAMHQYYADGEYSVRLQVRDSGGLSDQASLTVKVGKDIQGLVLIAFTTVFVSVLIATVIFLYRSSRPKAR